MKIYTKTGDKGTTSLYSGERRTKDDLVFDALGSVDELNANLGLAYEHLLQIKLCDELGETDMNNIELLKSSLTSVQSRLLDLGSCIATPIETTTSEDKINRVKFDNSNIEKVENWIDTLDGSLPPLKNFILPGGGLTASQLHVARTVCLEDVQKYLNRLSDFLFVAARYASKIEGKEEVVYKK
ncbi:predicted protein [Naegleria gruberi]|uniref:Predicted protein n=1 Tax=Naegleria gruberi TaxID=5762 RepID=D2V571_NAEGR|nr:uncharacterized protein NAEGRDRAFT_31057 [Naegleria gruberi]EFC48056.1 predicted protein [Naegleria gruberi]|eukprot:XP_002680800.1 predicted protein [Naegleria gruberi strain NEG-M]